MEEESISDADNITADTIIHTSNTQRENANVIFTSEKLDKSDEMADALKDLIINDAGYHESDTATASDAQVDPTRDPKTVTHISNGKGKVMETSNGNFKQKLLSNRNLPVVVPTMAPHTLLTPATKEFVVDPALGDAWVNRTPQQVSQAEIDRSIPCKIYNAVSVENASP